MLKSLSFYLIDACSTWPDLAGLFEQVFLPGVGWDMNILFLVDFYAWDTVRPSSIRNIFDILNWARSNGNPCIKSTWLFYAISDLNGWFWCTTSTSNGAWKKIYTTSEIHIYLKKSIIYRSWSINDRFSKVHVNFRSSIYVQTHTW